MPQEEASEKIPLKPDVESPAATSKALEPPAPPKKEVTFEEQIQQPKSPGTPPRRTKKTPGTTKQFGIKSTTRVKDWWDRIRSPAGGLREEDCLHLSDDDIDSGLMKLHLNMSHAPKTEMLKMLRIGKARSRALQRCQQFECSECQRLVPPRIQRPVKLPRTSSFNQILGIDLLEVKLTDGSRITGVNMTDEYTSFLV